jgi:hypothetical protein
MGNGEIATIRQQITGDEEERGDSIELCWGGLVAVVPLLRPANGAGIWSG